MPELLKDWWAIIMAVIGAVVWLIRLEARSLGNEKEIRRLWIQRKEDLASAEKSRKEDHDSAEQSRRENHDMLKEIRQDVKKLISGGKI